MAWWVEERVRQLERERDAAVLCLREALVGVRGLHDQLLATQREVEARATVEIDALRRGEAGPAGERGRRSPSPTAAFPQVGPRLQHLGAILRTLQQQCQPSVAPARPASLPNGTSGVKSTVIANYNDTTKVSPVTPTPVRATEPCIPNRGVLRLNGTVHCPSDGSTSPIGELPPVNPTPKPHTNGLDITDHQVAQNGWDHTDHQRADNAPVIKPLTNDINHPTRQGATKVPDQTTRQGATKGPDQTTRQGATKGPDQTTRQGATKGPGQTTRQEATKDGHHLISPRPVTSLRLLHTIHKTSGGKDHIRDLVFDPVRRHLVVRTSDDRAPLRVVELGGREVCRFGAGVPGLEEYRDLTLDMRRGRYLAACYDNVAILSREGRLLGRTDPLVTRIEGVAYCPVSDLYVISDCSEHRVTLLSPETLRNVRVFGGEGAATGSFKRPLHVATGRLHDNPAIVVSDHDNHRVQVFDTEGRHLVTYGRKGRGERELYYPRGVAMDPAGRVLVCDSVNSRVCAFWTDAGGEHWRCLVSREELGERKPINLHLCPQQEHLAVRLDNDSILLYKYS